jgi:hypothetical protein
MGKLAFRSLALVLFACVAAPTACRKDEPNQVVLPAGAIGRCESGIRKAVTKTALNEVMAIYYDECAEMYSEAGCRDAFHAAAHADMKEQVSIVMQGCRSAYCPLLGAYSYEACGDNFQMTPESVVRAWPKLQQAILAHEAGAYSGEVSNLLMALYAHTVKISGTDPAASAAAAAAAAAPPGSGAPSGSVAPPASGAPLGSAAPPASGAPATSAAPPTSASAVSKAKAPAAKPSK